MNLDKDGFLARKDLPNGKMLAVVLLTFSRGQLGIGGRPEDGIQWFDNMW